MRGTPRRSHQAKAPAATECPVPPADTAMLSLTGLLFQAGVMAQLLLWALGRVRVPAETVAPTPGHRKEPEGVVPGGPEHLGPNFFLKVALCPTMAAVTLASQSLGRMEEGRGRASPVSAEPPGGPARAADLSG